MVSGGIMVPPYAMLNWYIFKYKYEYLNQVAGMYL